MTPQQIIIAHIGFSCGLKEAELVMQFKSRNYPPLLYHYPFFSFPALMTFCRENSSRSFSSRELDIDLTIF